MYFREDNNTSFYDFNESCGMQFDMKNELIVIADSIPWEKFEENSDLFPSHTGRPSYRNQQEATHISKEIVNSAVSELDL